jgi:ABC-type uncharacterized transport system involved in gliding motility auxiliary subunit
LRALTGIALAGALLVAVVLLADRLLVGYRVDLTEDNLYTLSPETRAILADIDEPITLTLYFSRDAAEGVPLVRQYAQRVRELLEEYAALADGRLKLRTRDPEPLTPARERAREHGLKPVPAGNGDQARLFLGLVATNSTDGVETIEFFEPERERFLEHDLSRAIWSLAHPDKPVVGLMSPLAMTQGVNLSTGQARPPWAVVDRLEEVAEVRALDTPTARIDPAVDVLMLVHPQDYATETLYAIDQYLTHGGRAVVFTDPVVSTRRRGGPGGAGAETGGASELGPLLSAWGVDVALDRALADPDNGLVVSTGEQQRGVHPGLIGITRAGLAKRDVVTAAVERLVVGSPGVIADVDGGLDVAPLVQAAPSAGALPRERFVGLEQPGRLARGLRPAGHPVTMGARLSGDLRSAWPDGPPAGAQAPPEGHRAAAAEPAHLVLFADSDLLADRLWVQQRRQGQQSVRKAWAGNGDLVANAVQNLAGSDRLIRIRGAGTSARPFTRVRALEREAANRFRDQERELRQQLQQTEQRLEQLRSGQGEAEAGVILSAKQREELASQRERRSRLRRELREVRQRLDARKAALGDRLKLLNIVAAPAGVALAAFTVFGLRRRRRRTAA